ncbi:MAG TPA: F0F1 ATP synthase subunit alpha, partial [Candidatus Dojkabacteria bacterium]
MTDSKSIIDPIKKRIEEFDIDLKMEEVGEVISVKDGIATIKGLRSVQSQEMLEFRDGVIGIASNLEIDRVGAMILGDFTKISQGDVVRRTKQVMSIPVGEEMIGRVINPLGEAIDGQGELTTTETAPIEKIAPGVITREPVGVPLQTGIKAIDALIPVGRGQRELIIGDRQ